MLCLAGLHCVRQKKQNKKNVKKRKNVTKMKNVKNVFYIYGKKQDVESVFVCWKVRIYRLRMQLIWGQWERKGGGVNYLFYLVLEHTVVM